MSQTTSSTSGLGASDPNSIERDLDQTRSRLGSHLSELQDKFSPGQVLDDLMGYFRGSEGAEFGRSLMDSVRGNPMPAAVTAIGLAWLMASKPTGQAASPAWDKFGAPPPSPVGPHLYGREDYPATMTRVRQAEQDVARQPSETEHSYSARLDEARGQAIGLARHAQESTESFSQRVKDALAAAQQAIVGAAGSLAGQAGDAASAAGSTVSSLGASAQSAAQGAMQSALGALSQAGVTGGKAGGNLAATIAENPVMLGALGLAAGALLGALLPVSEQEEAALGGIAGQARDAATSLAQQGLASGKAVAETVMEKGRASVDAHGLTEGKTAGQFVDAALSGELAGNAKAVVQEVLQTGDEAIRKEVASSSPPKNPST